MLIFLGYLMVVTFMALIMTRRLSALVALVLVPLVFGLMAGHGSDLGRMAIDGISKLAPTAALLFGPRANANSAILSCLRAANPAPPHPSGAAVPGGTPVAGGGVFQPGAGFLFRDRESCALYS